MKVFISWSGNESKAVAEALARFLKTVIQSVSPWVSSISIDAGALWHSELTKELRGSKYAVLCVTGANLRSPWLNFEAGAVSMAFEGAVVCPYLLNLAPTEIRGFPLENFQACIADRDGTFNLLSSINNRLDDAALAPDDLRSSFRNAWNEYKKKLDNVRKTIEKSSSIFVSAPITSLASSQAYIDLREEVLLAIAHLQGRFGRDAVYSAVQRVEDKEGVDPERIGFQKDMKFLHDAARLVLFYPIAVASSVVFEAGYAYALRKPSVYFVKEGTSLPFVLEGAARHSSDLVNKLEYRDSDELIRLIDRHAELLFPGGE